MSGKQSASLIDPLTETERAQLNQSPQSLRALQLLFAFVFLLDILMLAINTPQVTRCDYYYTDVTCLDAYRISRGGNASLPECSEDCGIAPYNRCAAGLLFTDVASIFFWIFFVCCQAIVPLLLFHPLALAANLILSCVIVGWHGYSAIYMVLKFIAFGVFFYMVRRFAQGGEASLGSSVNAARAKAFDFSAAAEADPGAGDEKA